MPHPPPRPAAFHDMYYARAFPAYGHHLPHHSYPESNGRSTPDSDYSYDSKSRIRWILSLGLLLPALAAIIGVVAWAVSAEVVMGAHRESAMKASEAFRLSQGPRDLEWRAVQEDDINHISNPNNVNLAPPHLSPVRESGSSGGKEPDNNYDDPDTGDEEGEESEETTTASSSTTTSSSTASPVSITSPTKRTVTSTTTRRSTSTTTTRSTTPATTTTTAPSIRITEAKSKQSGRDDSRAKLSSKDLPVNASTIFFLNGVDGASDGPGKQGVKKSPGDQVAEVINRLVAQRQQTSGVTRHPHIVVVAPLHDPRKNNKSSGNRSTPTLSPRGGGGLSMQSWSPRVTSTSTTKRPTKITSSNSITMGKSRGKNTNDETETTTKAAILSKDADTLLAAAQMLAARHKMISMRRDEGDDDDEESEEDEEEEEKPRWQANKSRTSSSSSSSSSPSLTASASSLTEAATTASTTAQPIHRFQPISAPHPYPHPLPPPPPQQPPQQLHYPHPSPMHPLPPVHPHVGHVNQPQHGSPQPPPHPAFPSHPPPLHRLPQQHSSDRMGHMPLMAMGSHYAPSHSVLPVGRSLPPPPLSQQPHRPPPPPPSFGSPHIPHHQMMPHASHPHVRFMPHNHLPGPYPPPHATANPQQPQFIRGPQGQLLPLFGPFPMDGQQPPSSPPQEAAEETVTETVDESQVATTYEGSDSNPNKAVVQFHAEDPQPAASGANKGLTLHFGGGPMGGGGQLVTNPVGIFKTLLLPLLPKHHANFNGKLVFGFVLEKGVQKKKAPHPIVKFLPSHMYRH